MRRVTGGGAPAGIWSDFMKAALPRLRVQPIPGALPPPPPSENDPIGNLIEGVTDFLGVGGRGEPPAAPEDRPRARREEPVY